MADGDPPQHMDGLADRARSMFPLINRDNTCCFSGYRPEKLPWGIDEGSKRCGLMKETLLDEAGLVVLSGIRNFVCGMARGSDMFFCEAILFLREKYTGITLEAAIPYEGQSSGWREADRKRYDRLVEQCDFVTYVSLRYSKSCMIRRNRYMVDKSSVLLAVFDGKYGGTKNTMKYAAKRGLEIIEIKP